MACKIIESNSCSIFAINLIPVAEAGELQKRLQRHSRRDLSPARFEAERFSGKCRVGGLEKADC